MAHRRVDPKEQFSKWLARYGAIVWGLFLAAIIALMFFQPDTSMACVYMLLIVTVNKAIDTISYTKNSTSEKGFYWAVELAKALNGKKAEQTEDDSEGSEEGENG